MSNVLERIRKLKARRPQGGSGSRLRGIYHDWKEGDNVIRLVGDFLEVKTHFIAPAPKRKDRGLCMPTAFQGDGKIPMVMNCPNWDVENEKERDGHCPICMLHDIAMAVLAEGSATDEEKKFFEKLKSDTRASSRLKWNIVDRDDPYVKLMEDGSEKQVLGLKIASIGMEAWGDIEGIFEQCGFDISDAEQGIDVKVNRGHNGARVAYSAQAVLEGTSLKVTPLTAEEKALDKHDLLARCGRQVDGSKVIDALHEDIRQILELNADDTAAAPEATTESAPAEQPASAAKPADAVQEAVAEAVEEDDDSLLAGTAPKA